MSFPESVICGTAFHTPKRGQLEMLRECAIAINAEGRIDRIVRQESNEFETLVVAARNRGRLYLLNDGDYLIPGLVDLHIHAPQWPQLGKALDAPLEEWLGKYTFPLEARFSDHDFARAVYSDLVRTLLMHGTTTAVYFGTVDLEANVILANACLKHGQRALVGKVAMDHPEICPAYYRDESAALAVQQTQAFVEKVRSLQSGMQHLVLPAITPRFIPSCTDELLSELGKLAAEFDCHIQTHCSESDWQVAHVRERLGRTDCEALDDVGLLTDQTILAHSNFITDDDMDLLNSRQSAIAHCPLSNAYFANAVFPLQRALSKGVKVGLGTDISGGFSPSVFDAIHNTLTASRYACSGTDPALERTKRGSGESPLTTIEAFWLATAASGEALSLPIGVFREGYAFDAIAVSANGPGSAFGVYDQLDDDENIFEKLVLTSDRSAIQNVWVDGQIANIQ